MARPGNVIRSLDTQTNSWLTVSNQIVKSLSLCYEKSFFVNMVQPIDINSWLTISNQIVKSLSLCYEKSFFVNMVQPVDINFCKVVERIQQNIFNHADL